MLCGWLGRVICSVYNMKKTQLQSYDLKERTRYKEGTDWITSNNISLVPKSNMTYFLRNQILMKKEYIYLIKTNTPLLPQAGNFSKACGGPLLWGAPSSHSSLRFCERWYGKIRTVKFTYKEKLTPSKLCFQQIISWQRDKKKTLADA